MSSVAAGVSEVQAALADMTDDANVLTLRYMYGLNISQRIKEIFKEIINGKQPKWNYIDLIAHAVDDTIKHE